MNLYAHYFFPEMPGTRHRGVYDEVSAIDQLMNDRDLWNVTRQQILDVIEEYEEYLDDDNEEFANEKWIQFIAELDQLEEKGKAIR
jgi:hypothetical protein